VTKRSLFSQFILWLVVLSACRGSPSSLYLAEAAHNFPLRKLWSFEASTVSVDPPEPADGIILNSTADLISYALDAEGGDVLWQREISSGLGVLDTWRAIAEGKWILAGGRSVIAIDLRSGDLVWTADGFTAPVGVAVGYGMVFVASKGWVTALDLATGEAMWENASMPGYTFAVLYDETRNRVLVPAEEFYVLDPLSGELLAVIDTDLGCSARNYRIHGGWIYCIDRIYDASTGRLLFKFPYMTKDYLWYSLTDSEMLYFRTTSGSVGAIDMGTMSLKWEYRPTARENGEVPQIVSNVAALNSVGYAIADDATLRAFDLATGQEIGWWQAAFVAEERTLSRDFGVATDGERLYATFGGKTLYAFGP
jgi:outer membrane protein assembly factor BamB